MLKNKLINDAKIYVNKLLIKLDNNYYYHNYGHALDVMQRAYEIGKNEKVSKLNLEILSLAGLFHDVGFIIQYDDNEFIGSQIAKSYLTRVGYPKENIKQVERLILATRPSYKKPRNKLERIIRDADMDNLGRDDFFEKGKSLRREIQKVKNIKIRKKDWKDASVNVIKDYKFNTRYQKKQRSKKQIENLNNLILS